MHTGIRLDAQSIRDEIDDRLENDIITEANADIIEKLDDEAINAAIDASVDDDFWQAYDNARSDAIARLLRTQM